MKFNEATVGAYFGYKKQLEFNRSVQSICSLYSNQIPANISFPFRKIYVELHENNDFTLSEKYVPAQVIVMPKYFDFKAYWKKKNMTKRK